MKILPLLSTLGLSLCLSLSLTAQQKTYEQWCKALAKQNQAKAQSLCTETFWAYSENNGEELYEQSVRKEFTYKQVQSYRKKKRAVYLAEISREGRTVDKISLYLIKQKGKWLIDGVNESERMIGWFLDKKIPGYFHPGSLPADERLAELAKTLLEAPSDEAGRQQMFSPYLSESSWRFLDQLLDMESATLSKVYYADQMRRGAVVFKGLLEDYEQEICIYFSRLSKERWQADGYNYSRPTLDSFLTEREIRSK